VSRAIEFCKQILEATDPEVKKAIIEREHKKVARYGWTREVVALGLELQQMGIDVFKVLENELERATLARLQAKWGNQK
jgi:ADP-heptose:LPS heptosyltransferase